jgi:hypothetical protein
MRSDILIKIRSDPNLYKYLKYNSYWYKDLIRNPDSIKEVEEAMKKEYKLTTADKLNEINNKMNTLKMFLEIMND